MIDQALLFLTTFLNKKLHRQFKLNNDLVIASSLINPDGSVAENIENKIVISVINLEHETYMKSNGTYRKGGANVFGKIAPPVYLNVYLLISANYTSKNYLEAFKILSGVIKLLQANPYFTRNKNPKMPLKLSKITFEIFNIPITELSHIWSGIGAKYVPSIVYKMRMITMQEANIKEEVPGVGGLGNNVNAKEN